MVQQLSLDQVINGLYTDVEALPSSPKMASSVTLKVKLYPLDEFLKS